MNDECKDRTSREVNPLSRTNILYRCNNLIHALLKNDTITIQAPGTGTERQRVIHIEIDLDSLKFRISDNFDLPCQSMDRNGWNPTDAEKFRSVRIIHSDAPGSGLSHGRTEC